MTAMKRETMIRFGVVRTVAACLFVALCAVNPAHGASAAPSSAPAAGAPTARDQDAIMRAAGFKRQGGEWVGCDGQSSASIAPGDIRDINNDGRLDAIVTDTGTACYGMTGQGFVLLTRTAPGQWRKLYESEGIPEFLTTGAKGWPDVEIGGPGFCAPVLRWNGKTYTKYRQHETMRGGCAARR